MSEESTQQASENEVEETQEIDFDKVSKLPEDFKMTILGNSTTILAEKLHNTMHMLFPEYVGGDMAVLVLVQTKSGIVLLGQASCKKTGLVTLLEASPQILGTLRAMMDNPDTVVKEQNAPSSSTVQ